MKAGSNDTAHAHSSTVYSIWKQNRCFAFFQLRKVTTFSLMSLCVIYNLNSAEVLWLVLLFRSEMSFFMAGFWIQIMSDTFQCCRCLDRIWDSLMLCIIYLIYWCISLTWDKSTGCVQCIPLVYLYHWVMCSVIISSYLSLCSSVFHHYLPSSHFTSCGWDLQKELRSQIA